jgi:uncharacterized membrane protein YdjX (TVP38/TMEM64 family)
MIPGTLLFVYIGSTAASITEAVAGNTTQTPLQQVSSAVRALLCFAFFLEEAD